MARPNRKNSAQNGQFSGTKPSSPDAAAARLAGLLLAKQTIPYHENIPDPEFPSVLCSVYGAPGTNELFVKLTNGTVTFVEVIDSPLLSPPMADRIFGMDELDNAVAFNLADQMWEKNKVALIANPPSQTPPP